MVKIPQRVKLVIYKLWIVLLLATLVAGEGLFAFTGPAAAYAEADADVVRYSAPRLPSDAKPYDPEHPEDLEENQLLAKSAILIEADSGKVIFEKNADERMPPASTTKILTTLLGLEMAEFSRPGALGGVAEDGSEGGNMSLSTEQQNFANLMRQAVSAYGFTDADLFEQTMTMSESALILEEGAVKIPLEAGETIHFEDLLFATMVRSGNDGANLIAEILSGSVNDFSVLMNAAVQAFGLQDTHFMNPSGLHHNDHFSTVRDMAKISQIAMENPKFQSIAKTYSFSLRRSNLRSSRVLISGSDAILNPNISDNDHYYPYANGIKTGFHSRAGYCFASSAERNGVKLISVVFYTSETGRWTDTQKLMEYGFSQFVSMTPHEMYNQNPIVLETSGFSMDDTELGRLRLNLKPLPGMRTVYIVDTRAELEAMARNLKQNALIQYSRTFATPIEAGEVFGTLTYQPKDGGSPVSYELIASRSIARRLNAPRSIEEIEAEVNADPNPFPAFSGELLMVMLAPLVILLIIFRLLMHLFRRTGRHKKGRVPKPENRYFR